MMFVCVFCLELIRNSLQMNANLVQCLLDVLIDNCLLTHWILHNRLVL